MRQIIAILALALAFTAPVLAGNIEEPGSPVVNGNIEEPGLTVVDNLFIINSMMVR